MKDHSKHWIILRTASRSTLRLAESLAKDGFEVWAPVETRTIRAGRTRARVEVKAPLLPSYVFAKAPHLVDLLELAAMPVKPRRGAGLMEPAHSSFSVLHSHGRIPLVEDRHFADLRRIEAKRTPARRAAYSFPRNASARVSGGLYGGLVGVVVRSNPAKTVLCFTGAHTVEMPTSLLDMDAIQNARPGMGIAA